jgi:eukaryotic-like serine/threonine-protein kinase
MSEPKRTLEADAPTDSSVDSQQAEDDREWMRDRTAFLRLQSGALPQAFGRYELRSELGRGAMGIVYEAYDAKTGETVALKVMGPEHTDLERFQREGEIAKAVDHVHVVPVYDVGQHRGVPYYTMKLVAGGRTLRSQARGFADPVRAAALIATLARTVHDVHLKGILHRDLKPSNVLLGPDEHPLIADFGLARRAGAAALTETGQPVGTLHYRAPEQAAGDHRAVEPTADVYSLGVILYELLTGCYPFAGATRRQSAELATRAPPAERPVPEAPPLAPELAAICERCLKRNALARYPDARELAEDLERFVRGEQPRACSRSWRMARELRAVRGRLLAVGALALVLAGIVYAWQTSAQR